MCTEQNNFKNGLKVKNKQFIIIIYPVIFLIFFVFGYYFSHHTISSYKIYKRSKIVLGTIVEVQIKTDGNPLKYFSEVFNELERTDTLFSNFINNSQIQNINKSNKDTIDVNYEIFNLLKLSDKIYKYSGGSFDVSLGRVIQLWQFDSENPFLPSIDSIRKALTLSGWNYVKLLSNNLLVKNKPVYLDLSSIAKGYAVDKAIDKLKELNIKDALVNAGGEVKVIGKEWEIGIQHPRLPEYLIKKVSLSNLAVATSGDYEKYFIKDGKRYHHLINPKTGFPENRYRSVSVITESCALADALATALFLSTPKDRENILKNFPNAAAMFIDSTGNIFYSNRFEKYFKID